jgi:glycosyltransferase involved in cell wall biosynthesis
MRILYLSTSMGMGGADKLLISAAQEMRCRGHQILIVSLTPLGPMGLQARGAGIATESLQMRRGFPDPRGLLRLVRLVRSWRPDILHSHMIHANLMARALRLVVPLPALVSTIHNIYEGGPLWMAAYRLTNGLVDHMTIVSQTAADRFIRESIIPKKLLRVLPNGLDTAPFRSVPAGTRESLRSSLGLDDKFVWLAVGRFEVAKDYPNMLHGFAKVREQDNRAVLLLVGRGSLQAETEALSRDLGLGGSVRFLGVRNDVPEVMSAADGYVLSSAWEGMPIVLLEAAAAGLPIVATVAGGNSEVVSDGVSGFLVPPRESDSLSRAMLRLMGLSEPQRRSMGERGRENVRIHHGLERMVDRWEDLYREVLLDRPGLDPIPPSNTPPAGNETPEGIVAGNPPGPFPPNCEARSSRTSTC